MEAIQKIRELELLIRNDAKQVNSIIAIKKYLNNVKASYDVRIAALHSLRRIFIDLIDTGKFTAERSDDKKNEKKAEYLSWLRLQLSSFQDSLLELLSSQKDSFSAPVLRTLLEFIKREYLVEKTARGGDVNPRFGSNLFKLLMLAVIDNGLLDIDLLLILKEEVFEYHDCTYYCITLVKELIQDTKQQLVIEHEQSVFNGTSSDDTEKTDSVMEIRKKNLIDILRILVVPDELEQSRFLVVVPGKLISTDDGEDEQDDDLDSDEEEEAAKARKVGAKSKLPTNAADAKKSVKAIKVDNLYNVNGYRKVFTQAWLLLLSLPLSLAQHKLLLSHLSKHVMSVMSKPILLADYLTQSYNMGGVVSVLALESLFTLIAKYNLDYPKFFLSLYNLCTIQVFSAKYAGKFMKLLNASLRSVNLPGYLVAAFIKRLSFLSLYTNANNAPYFIAQIVWLLRHHPQSQVLIHRTKKSSTDSELFDNTEDRDLETSHALSSSLWELEYLSKHHIYNIASAAEKLKDFSTAYAGKDALFAEQYIDMQYGDLSSLDFAPKEMFSLKPTKPVAQKHSVALAYKKPESLLTVNSFASACFGK